MSSFWKSWLTVWWWGMVIASIAFTAAAIPGLDGPVLVFYDIIDGPLDGQSHFTEATRPTTAILGAVFLGFALAIGAMIRMAHAAPAAAAAALWRTITIIILTWYGVDSTVSVLTGIPLNAVSNTAILAAYLLPVLASGVLKAAGAPRSA